MVSAFVGGPAAQYPAPLSAGLMAGFGPPSGGPYLGGSDPTQRLQYYDSQQPSGHAVAGKDVSGRRSGKVKFFDTQKGYGFINDYRPEDIGHEEVFVHYTAITAKAGFKSLAEGEEAEYDLVRGPKGFQAANVTGPGGSQVVGDTRSRVNKNAFLAMSPYAAMFPYMHQDPTSFFASSAYSQPVMLIPPQTEYRNPAPLSASAYRTVPPAPTYAATPSSYASPAAIRPYDISKDWPGSSLSSLSVNDGGRSSKPAGSSSAAPFGGMFGAIPGFETLPNTSISAQQGSAPVHQSLSSSALGAGFGSAGQMAAGQPYKAFGTTVASGYARSGSVDGGDNLPSTSPRDSTISRPTDTGPAPRPAAQHSRSSSLLYASKKSGSPAA